MTNINQLRGKIRAKDATHPILYGADSDPVAKIGAILLHDLLAAFLNLRVAVAKGAAHKK